MALIFSTYEIGYFMILVSFFILDYIYSIQLFNIIIINSIVLEYIYNCYKQCNLYNIVFGFIWLTPIFLMVNEYVPIGISDRDDIFKLIILNSVSDTTQSFMGKLLGKYMDYRPFKYISPSKTLIGYIGGLSITYVIALLLNFNNIFIVLLLNVFGDLGASYIKRTMGIKDFSYIFGAKGGILDRVDSSTLNIPFNYFYKYYC